MNPSKMNNFVTRN